MTRDLFNRNFLLLWQGQLVSHLGNQAFSLAMVYWLMETTGSASLMGLLMIVSLLPGVVLGPLGGVLADRHSRLGIIIVSDLLRGLGVLALAALMFLRPGASELIVGMLFVVALFSGIINAVFQPAIAASIPDLVPRGKIAAGNSLTQFSVQASVLVGQAVGGLLYRLLGAAYLFLIDGLTYLFSALSEAFIRIPQKRPDERVPGKKVLAAYMSDTIHGVRYVWGRPGMRSFLGVAGAFNFLAMPVFILLPFYVTDWLLKDAAWYGFLLAAIGAGSLFGYLLAGTVKVSAQRRPWVITSALLGTAVLLAIAGSVRDPGIALILFFGIGIFTGAINIFVITLFQTTTPGEMRGRVMALVITLSGAATPLGMALGGVLGDATNKNIPVLYFACGALIGVLVVTAFTRPSFRAFLQWDAPAANDA